MSEDADRRAFDAAIQAGRGGAYVEVPFDVREVYGAARPRVRATFDSRPDPPYRGSLAPTGSGRNVLGILKAIRTEIGKGPGDTVRVEVWPDTEPREIEVPADLDAALRAEEGVRAAFDALAVSHRREYVQWIEEAKRPETRARRLARTVALVRAREKRSPGG